jgi:hypothetical protein
MFRESMMQSPSPHFRASATGSVNSVWRTSRIPNIDDYSITETQFTTLGRRNLDLNGLSNLCNWFSRIFLSIPLTLESRDVSVTWRERYHAKLQQRQIWDSGRALKKKSCERTSAIHRIAARGHDSWFLNRPIELSESYLNEIDHKKNIDVFIVFENATDKEKRFTTPIILLAQGMRQTPRKFLISSWSWANWIDSIIVLDAALPTDRGDVALLFDDLGLPK